MKLLLKTSSMEHKHVEISVKPKKSRKFIPNDRKPKFSGILAIKSFRYLDPVRVPQRFAENRGGSCP